jgi:hypothetical protein
MSPKKGGKSSGQKPYKGPWPEEHRSIPGRAPTTGTPGGHDRSDKAHTPPQTPVHKVPPQTPK